MLHVLSLFFITSTSAVSIRTEAQRHLVSLCIESRTVQNGVDTFRRVLELPWERVNFPNEFTHAVHETHILSGAFNLERTQQTQPKLSVNISTHGGTELNTTNIIGDYVSSRLCVCDTAQRTTLLITSKVDRVCVDQKVKTLVEQHG